MGSLDVLVTAAGIGGSGLFMELEEAVWTRVIDVNLNGTYPAIRASLPQMMKQGEGRIITMMEAEEIANGTLFLALALPESRGVTGQGLNIDGGFVMS